MTWQFEKMRMKKLIPVVILAGLSISGYAQNVGLSFSYFIPKNGYVSTPISPFSIRGLGVNLTKHIALETGASLYRMSGLSMKDLPLSGKEPFVGPNFTVFVPGEIVFELKGSNVEFDIKAGGFAFYGFSQKLNYGNIDRAIRNLEGWAVANSQLEFKNKPGCRSRTHGLHNRSTWCIHRNKLFSRPIQITFDGHLHRWKFVS
jgi:hypothetical protein